MKNNTRFKCNSFILVVILVKNIVDLKSIIKYDDWKAKHTTSFKFFIIYNVFMYFKYTFKYSIFVAKTTL